MTVVHGMFTTYTPTNFSSCFWDLLNHSFSANQERDMLLRRAVVRASASKARKLGYLVSEEEAAEEVRRQRFTRPPSAWLQHVPP